VLIILAGDDSEEVRMEVARNAASPPQLLIQLLVDTSSAIRKVALSNPNRP